MEDVWPVRMYKGGRVKVESLRGVREVGKKAQFLVPGTVRMFWE